MGKGRGRGRGKGGCECCEAIHALACCLCLVLFGGPILIAIGSTLIAAANRNDRARGIDAVQAAVKAWNDPSSLNGWKQFQKLVAFANMTSTTASCAPSYLQLQVDLTSPQDRYWDEERLFSNIKQLRLSAYTNYSAFMDCRMTVNLTWQIANGTGTGPLVYLPAMASGYLDYSILLDEAGGPKKCSSRTDGCATLNAGNCRFNCENYFDGEWKCNGGNFQCNADDLYYNNFAIKVSYQDNGYFMDSSNPGPGGGANVLPAGYQRQYDAAKALPSTVTTGPLFQLPNVVRYSATHPDTFSVTVRSSGDPWLTYMAVTDGTGYFGFTKSALMATGATLVVIGSLGTLFWLVTAFYAWRMLCSRHKPRSRPSGISGYAWDLANRYGGPYAPALGVPVHGVGQGGMPTAQPLYVGQGPPYVAQPARGQPVPGYPPYPYPPPYGAPQPGLYPPYTYPSPYPPPSNGIEMNQFNSAHPPAYGYPPPGQGASGAHGGTPAPYQYPYPYPYPPYAGAPSGAPQRAPLQGAPQPPSSPPPPPATGGSATAPSMSPTTDAART